MPELAVRIYCPKITDFEEESAADRAARLVEAIQGAGEAGIQLLVAPEYFFTHNTSTLLDPTVCIAYSADEADEARGIVAAATDDYPGLTVVAGSFFMEQGVANPHDFNTSFVYRAGAKVAESSKRGVAADATYAELCGLPFYSGDGGWAFEADGVECWLQICQDSLFAPPQSYPLSVLPAFQPGGAVLANIKSYQARVVSDGVGRYAVIYSDGRRPLSGAGPVFDVLLAFADGDGDGDGGGGGEVIVVPAS